MGRPWAVDLTDGESSHRESLPKPPGFSESSSHDADEKAVVKKVDQTQLKLKV